VIKGSPCSSLFIVNSTTNGNKTSPSVHNQHQQPMAPARVSICLSDKACCRCTRF
jgi:hypothetical protein